MLIIIAVFPTTIAENHPTNEIKIFETNQNSVENYLRCKIESSGIPSTQIGICFIKIANQAFAGILTIEYGNDGATTIYSSENNEQLWHYECAHKLILILYRGILSYQECSDGSLKTLIDGKALFVKAKPQ